MKINEIITESRSQLDEGMMDTIKSKLSQVYQMARKKYPNFDEVFAIAKSHKSEINDIIEQLKAKKETSKLSKEDVVAAIMPLSKKVAGEVGGKGMVNESFGAAFASAIGGAIISPIIWFAGTAFTGGELLDFSNTFFTCVAIAVAIGLLVERDQANFQDRQIDAENKRRAGMSSRQLEQEEYDSLERKYKNNRYDMSYAQKRRMEELYNKGYR